MWTHKASTSRHESFSGMNSTLKKVSLNTASRYHVHKSPHFWVSVGFSFFKVVLWCKIDVPERNPEQGR